jgi:hypothetical protein
MGEERKVYKVSVGKPEGKRPLGRPRHRREDGIRIDLREAWGVWIGFNWLSIGTGGGLLCGDEPSGSCATELVNITLEELTSRFKCGCYIVSNEVRR